MAGLGTDLFRPEGDVTAWSELPMSLVLEVPFPTSPDSATPGFDRLRAINSLYLSVSLCSFLFLSFSCLIFSSENYLDSYRIYFLSSKLGS